MNITIKLDLSDAQQDLIEQIYRGEFVELYQAEENKNETKKLIQIGLIIDQHINKHYSVKPNYILSDIGKLVYDELYK